VSLSKLAILLFLLAGVCAGDAVAQTTAAQTTSGFVPYSDGIGMYDSAQYIRLAGRFGIFRWDAFGQGSGQEGYSIVGEDRTEVKIVVRRVDSYAVSNMVIFGTTDHGFFILDTLGSPSPSDSLYSIPRPAPRLFTNREDWRAAIRLLHANPDQPLTPANQAPWPRVWVGDFRIMHGLLGLSDGLWALVILLAAVFISFSIGLKFGLARVLTAVSIVITGGAAIFLGAVGSFLIAMTPVCYASYRLGALIHWTRLWRYMRDVRDPVFLKLDELEAYFAGLQSWNGADSDQRIIEFAAFAMSQGVSREQAARMIERAGVHRKSARELVSLAEAGHLDGERKS
jgi:hypothetical protein